MFFPCCLRLQICRSRCAALVRRLSLSLSHTCVLTSFICADVLPRYRILLVHLVLQMLLPLRQHFQRAPQAQNGILGAVLFLRSVAAPKAAESPARHGVGGMDKVTARRATRSCR